MNVCPLLNRIFLQMEKEQLIPLELYEVPDFPKINWRFKSTVFNLTDKIIDDGGECNAEYKHD